MPCFTRVEQCWAGNALWVRFQRRTERTKDRPSFNHLAVGTRIFETSLAGHVFGAAPLSCIGGGGGHDGNDCFMLPSFAWVPVSLARRLVHGARTSLRLAVKHFAEADLYEKTVKTHAANC